MGLNDQVKQTRGSTNPIFKEHIKSKYLQGDEPILFRILPAFHPENPQPHVSWIPFKLPNGELTDWGHIIYVSSYVGHGGKDYGMRRSILSPKSFDENLSCPLETLYTFIRGQAGEWKYLLEDSPDGTVRKAFSRPGRMFLCNIIEVQRPDEGVKVGVLSQGATSSLLDKETGLCYQRSAHASSNYLDSWACGDITDPNTGAILRYFKSKNLERGRRYASGRIELVIEQQGVARFQLLQPHLAQRVNFSNPEKNAETYLRRLTDQQIVDELVELLNGRSPVTGQHERVLLKQAFPQFKIPDPPATYVNLNGGGFGANPAPAPVPGSVPGPAGIPPAAPVAPTPSVPVTPGVPITQTIPAPAALGVPASPGVPVTPTIPAAPTAPAAIAVPGIPAAVAPTTPVAPGDTIDASKFDAKAFMAKLAGNKT